MLNFRVDDLIEKKKKFISLSKDEIDFLIKNYTNKSIPDYQMSALLMAIWFNGMKNDEINFLTEAMVNSGEKYDLSSFGEYIVDKHSTGGIGDKVSLILGPILASLDVKIAKMSGRGLGYTGGTLDKLESIDGFNINLSKDAFIKQISEINLAIIGQSEKMVLADKMLYSLRDVTATVDSIPLIASSIMSKKIAMGANLIFLDVKCGNGAFMKNIKNAKHLSRIMINIGKHMNKKVVAEITNMSQPLGRAIGNRNEVLEAIDALKNNWQTQSLKKIIFSSAITILILCNKVKKVSEAIKLIENVLKNGKAYEKFEQFISCQGGNIKLLNSSKFWNPKYKLEIKANKKGYMKITSSIDFGLVSMKLGAGREKKEDKIDFDAGIFLNKTTGEKVLSNETIFTLFSSKEIDQEIVNDLSKSYKIVKIKPKDKIILSKMN